jgi:hypothetical protein
MKNDLNPRSQSAIRITRVSLSLDTRRPFNIFIDGEESGSLKTGESILLPVSPGRHILTARIGRIESQPLQVESKEGEELSIQLDCLGFNARNVACLFLLFAICAVFGKLVGSIFESPIAGGIGLLGGLLAAGEVMRAKLIPKIFRLRLSPERKAKEEALK